MVDNYEARVSSNTTLDTNDPDFFNTNDQFDDLEDDFLDIYDLSFRQRVLYQGKRKFRALRDKFLELSLIKKSGIVLLVLLKIILVTILIQKREAILQYLVKISNDLNSKWYTPILIFSLIFLVSFPPLIGYSSISSAVGLIYQVSFKAWLLLSFSTVVGSVVSFAVFKTVLHSQAERMIRWNTKLEAISSVLQDHNSYWILAMIRLCPFPYSFTNGGLAAIYGVSIRNFAIANVITTPKLLLYLFVGSRLRKMGETESSSSRLLNLFSIFLAVIFAMITTWTLYSRVKKRYHEIRRDQQNNFDVF